jgi:anti-sigma regulatory factor (Ser/Thr protein kinase)
MSAASPSAVIARAGFRHEALLYEGTTTFLDAVVPFVRAGLDAEEPVLVALSTAKIDAVRDVLGGDAEAVTFSDMTELGQNPARILPAWREFVETTTAPRAPRRGVAEPIWQGRSQIELIECQRHEALLNVAFDADTNWWLLCPYDISTLDETIIDEARRSHPHLLIDGEHHTSPNLNTNMAAAFLDAPLPAPPTLDATLSFGADDLRLVRDHVAGHVVASGMSASRGFDLLVAVSEVATNSLVHGGGHGELRVWHDGGSIVCELSDDGRLANPLAGRETPEADADGNRGLWIANQLCDLVQIRVFDTGTVVRLHMATTD